MIAIADGTKTSPYREMYHSIYSFFYSKNRIRYNFMSFKMEHRASHGVAWVYPNQQGFLVTSTSWSRLKDVRVDEPFRSHPRNEQNYGIDCINRCFVFALKTHNNLLLSHQLGEKFVPVILCSLSSYLSLSRTMVDHSLTIRWINRSIFRLSLKWQRKASTNDWIINPPLTNKRWSNEWKWMSFIGAVLIDRSLFVTLLSS